MKVVHLKPLSSFRTELRSDTLWGLLMIAIKNVYSEKYLEEVLEQFYSGNPPFINSSVFYYCDNNSNGTNKKTYFLPKPILRTYESNNVTSADVKTHRKNLENLKRFKKKTEVDLVTFENLINGEKSEFDLFNEFSPDNDNSKELYTKKEIVTKKVAIDRLTTSTREEYGKGQLYSMNEIYLENGGLYFLVDGDTSILEPALRFLQHYGFGADSSNGKGHFALSVKIFEDFSIRQPDDGNFMINLGIYNPKAEELSEYKKKKDKIYYSLEKRTGKIGVTFFGSKDIFKDSVLCFGEGSVFPTIINSKFVGKINVVKELDNKKIYHNGLGFMIKANLRET